MAVVASDPSHQEDQMLVSGAWNQTAFWQCEVWECRAHGVNRFGVVGLVLVKLPDCTWTISASQTSPASWKVLSALGQGSDLPLWVAL